MNILIRHCMVLLACLLATGCSRLTEEDATQAEAAHVSVATQTPGVTPFIANLALGLDDFANLDSVSFTATPKPGTYSKPLALTHTRAWLERRGAWSAAGKRLAFPVFGLYASYQNNVIFTARFRDASPHVERLTLAAPAYTGPGAVYATPVVRTARSAAVSPGFDYMLVQNAVSTPVLLDTDGNVRWIGAGPNNSISSLFNVDAFIVGSQTLPELYRVELDGSTTTRPLASTRYTNFHHDLTPGKTGLLAELDALDGGIPRIESILAEISPTGEVIKEWDLAALFRAAMLAAGDDPSNSANCCCLITVTAA